MAKKRSWHFYLFVITFTIFLLGYLLWKYTPVKDEVKAVIINKLQPYLGESFIIRDFNIGLNSVSFYQVSATRPASGVSLDIKEIRVGIDYLKFLTRNFSVPEMIESVHFRNPRLSFQPLGGPRPNPKISPEKVLEEILSNMRKFPEIDHISIDHAELYWLLAGLHPDYGAGAPPQPVLLPSWELEPENEVPLMEGLGGKLRFLPGGKSVELDFVGRLPGIANSSLNLFGEVNFEQKTIDATLDLEECRVTSDWPFWKLNYFILDGAHLGGRIRVSNANFVEERLKLDGALTIADFSAHIFGQHARADSVQIRLKDQRLIIEPFALAVEDGRGQFWGEIPDLYNPEVDWKLNIQDYSVRHLRNSHHIFQYAHEGKASVQGQFSGPLKQMTITAHAECPDLLYSVVPFNTNVVDLTYNVKDKFLNFDHLQAKFHEFRTRGTGHINFKSNHINLWLDSDIYVPESYFTIFNGLNDGKVLVHTDFTGNVSTLRFHGEFTYEGRSGDSLLVRGQGPFTLDDQLLRFNLRSQDISPPFLASGTIENLFSEPEFSMLEAKDFPVIQLTRNPLIAGFLEDRHVNMYFAGPYYSLYSKMNIVNANPLEKVISVSSNIWDIFEYHQKFRGNFSIYSQPKQVDGNFTVAFTRQGFDARIMAPDLLAANFYVGAQPNDPFSGSVSLEKMPLKEYVQSDSLLASTIGDGHLVGNAEFSGTVGNPTITFDLAAEDLILNTVGYYNGRFSGKLHDYELNFEDLRVQLNNARILDGKFYWHSQSDSLVFRAAGQNIESNFIAETIFRDPTVIRGNSDFTVIGSGKLSQPVVYGNLNISEGELSGNRFQNISLSVEDSLDESRNFWSIRGHVVKIRNFLYNSRSDYTVASEGILSLHEDGPLDLEIDVRGNVLAELPKLDPYFINPRSTGEFYGRVEGTRANPYFREINLQIYDGSMSFDGVLPPVRNLRASVELTNADNFIQIKNIEGLVDGRHARIYNEASVTTAKGPLENWFFEDIDLDFGVLVLETDPQGIPLELYGMMEENERGYFNVAGRTPEEKFYFAGPPSLPIARGKVTMYDARVTYPFIGMVYEDGEYVWPESDVEDKVFDFLMNMRWDILSVPGKNNRYFVNIPAYVGEVAMDLNIDNTSRGFEYSGRLVDDSFRIEGEVSSSRGRVSYLDANFRVVEFGAEFNTFDIYPEVYGKAFTTVRDSTGSLPRDIFLVLYVTDPVTKKEVAKGRWEDFRFKLVTQEQLRDRVFGETQEQVLAYLGYSFDNLQTKAGEVGLSMTENILIRPLFRPIERKLERKLNLDYVRLRSNFTSNLFLLSLQDRTDVFNRFTFLYPTSNNNLDPALLLLQSSEMTLGKYLVQDVYLSYTGQLVSLFDEAKLGVNHTFGLEYRLLYNLLLEVEYYKLQFNPFYAEEFTRETDYTRDLRIRLRHSFNF